jgi:hypothetical protein
MTDVNKYLERINKINFKQVKQQMNWFKNKDMATTVLNVVTEADKNKDGTITLSELIDLAATKAKDLVKDSKFANMGIATEYIILFIVLVSGVLGYFIPSLNEAAFAFNAWIPVLSIGLIAGNIIYGGVLKSNFAKQLLQKDSEKRETQATLDATKEALSKASIENERLKMEKDFWQSRYNESHKRDLECPK